MILVFVASSLSTQQ